MSSNLKQIHMNILSFSKADKFVFGGCIALILGLFLPWFSINASEIIAQDIATANMGFTGIVYIVGYLAYFFALFSLNTLERKLPFLTAGICFVFFLLNLGFSKDKEHITLFATFIFLLLNLGTIFFLNNSSTIKQIKKHFINLFVGIENIILIFVASMIYHKHANNFTSANLNFGLYITLIGAILIAYGGYLQLQSYKKISTKEVFAHSGSTLHRGINLKPDLNIDKNSQNQNNDQASESNKQLSFGDYE